MRLRQRRTMLDLTLMELAEALGVSYQQLHKYETGVNRLSASTLYSCACTLGIDINYFFEGLEATAVRSRPSEELHLLLELLRQFVMIQDPCSQAALLSCTRSVRQGHEGVSPTTGRHRR